MVDRSVVVKHLRNQFENTTIGVASVYLNHKETESQSCSNVLAGLWQQLVTDRTLSPTVHELYKNHCQKRTRPTVDEVFGILQSAIWEHSKLYFVVDALDEYPEDHRNILLKYLTMLGTAVNLMITCRPHISLDPFFPQVTTIKIRAKDNDIRRYVDNQIKISSRLSRHVQSRPDLQGEIQSKIVENAKGM